MTFLVDRDIPPLVEALKERFHARLVYVGLQGSYLRGEAREQSDVDIMLVLEDLQPEDLDAYRSIIATMPWADRACGFICGREELSCWNRLELMHLLHATKDLYGTLSPLLPAYSAEDVREYVRLSVGNLYHELCHRRIYAPHEKNERKLSGAYKAAFFILQDLYWLKTGSFVPTKRELFNLLDGNDRAVLAYADGSYDGTVFDFDHDFYLLFDWCRTTLCEL